MRQVVLDYRATGLSLKAHPVSFARDHLRSLGVRLCGDLGDPLKSPNNEWVIVAGLVLVRQRPGTAEGVTFMTLEDETGIANLIVWRRVYHKFRRQLGSRLVIASGRVQRQGEVVHVIVSRARNLDDRIDDLMARPRNFR
jgi:error-prone DNA polymerase